MVAHLLIVLLVKVDTKEILKFSNTKVIAIDRDIESKKIADQIKKKFCR